MKLQLKKWSGQFLCLLMFILFNAAYVHASDNPNQKDHSVSKHTETLAIKDVCAWPNLTKMSDGSIIATIFNRPSHGQCEGTIECWQTKDEGQTWQHLSTPIHNDPNTNRMNVAAGLAKNGDFVIVVSGWLKRPGGGLTNNDWRAAVLEPAVCRSADGGKTWTVSGKFPQSGQSTPFIPFGDILQDDESLVLSAYTVDYTVEPAVYHSFFFRSFDDGRTWQKESKIADNCNETAILKIQEADLWTKWIAAARNSKTQLELYESYNDGQSWRFDLFLTEIKEGPGHFLRLSDNRILLSYGNRRADRYGVDARLSADEGATWSDSIHIADTKISDGGYPASVELKDGRILTVYYAKESSLYDNYHMASVVWSLPEYKAVHLMDVEMKVEPDAVRSGQTFTVNASCGGTVKYYLTTAYTVGRQEVPPGFAYDERANKCSFKDDNNDGSLTIKTDGWKPGLYHLALIAEDQTHHTYRDFAVKVLESKPALKVTVLQDDPAVWGLKERALINFITLADGTILANPYSSSDGGRIWQKDRAVAGHTGCVLDDGKLVLIGGIKEDAIKNDGQFKLTVHESPDGCKTVSTSKGQLLVPDFTPGFAHGPYDTPLLYRSVVALSGGKMLATMYGRMQGDNIPWNWNGVQEAMKTRSFVVQSADSGKTWEYLSTLAAGTETGMEGFNETAMIRLGNGTLLAVVRSGDNAHTGWEDNQLYQVISADEGKTWSKPVALGVEGVSPDLCLMRDGTLVCSYGRPGVNLMFSRDNGKSWTGHTCIHPARYKCYTAVCEGNPNELVLSYIIDTLSDDKGTTKREARIAIVSVKTVQ